MSIDQQLRELMLRAAPDPPRPASIDAVRLRVDERASHMRRLTLSVIAASAVVALSVALILVRTTSGHVRPAASQSEPHGITSSHAVTSGTSPSIAPTSTTTKAEDLPCRAEDLEAVYTGGEAPMVHKRATVAVANTADRVCVLRGDARVILLDDSHRRIVGDVGTDSVRVDGIRLSANVNLKARHPRPVGYAEFDVYGLRDGVTFDSCSDGARLYRPSYIELTLAGHQWVFPNTSGYDGPFYSCGSISDVFVTRVSQ